MPARQTIMDNGRVSYLKMTDPWTVDDVLQEVANDKAMFDCAQTTIYTIIDMSECKEVPDAAFRLLSIPSITHEMSAYNVKVGAPVIIQALGRIFSRLSGNEKLV